MYVASFAERSVLCRNLYNDFHTAKWRLDKWTSKSQGWFYLIFPASLSSLTSSTGSGLTIKVLGEASPSSATGWMSFSSFAPLLSQWSWNNVYIRTDIHAYIRQWLLVWQSIITRQKHDLATVLCAFKIHI